MEENLSVLDGLNQAIQNLTWVEIGAVITGLIYVILAAREQIACWFFGILSSLLSIYLFYTGQLYAESILYIYYVIAGIYGWWAWTNKTPENQNDNLRIHRWSWQQHAKTILIGLVLSLSLAAVLANFTNAKIPILDSFTTIFSFVATYMVTRKILENWIYWIVIDIVTTGMYYHRGFYLYAVLMIVYTIIAIIGYQEWLQRIQKNPNSQDVLDEAL